MKDHAANCPVGGNFACTCGYDQERQMDELMDFPCPVCRRRFGEHKAVPGWIGAGCPALAKVDAP